MKSVLVYKAQDIFIREAIYHRLQENGIEVFGTDTSINVVYPNTPNLYFAGASSLFEGYKIFVSEDQAIQAKTLIDELEKELQLNPHTPEQKTTNLATSHPPYTPDDYFRRFQWFTFISLVIPILPIPIAIYYFYKLLRSQQPFKLWKACLLWFFLFLSIGLGVFSIDIFFKT